MGKTYGREQNGNHRLTKDEIVHAAKCPAKASLWTEGLKMRKMLLFALLLCLCSCAHAEALPQGAVDLWTQAWPDHTICAWYGWADESAGQLLAALEKEGDHVLCMAERKPGAEWELTMKAPKALRDHGEPDLFLDTDGDTLIFSYWEGEKKISYHATRAPSGGREWGYVSAIVYDGMEQWVICAKDGQWLCEYYLVDENDNTLEHKLYPPLEMTEEKETLKLEAFDINSLPLHHDEWK